MFRFKKRRPAKGDPIEVPQQHTVTLCTNSTEDAAHCDSLDEALEETFPASDPISPYIERKSTRSVT